jgi:hypothetical protein
MNPLAAERPKAVREELSVAPFPRVLGIRLLDRSRNLADRHEGESHQMP